MPGDSSSPKGAYDLALFVARSFGRSLPVIVIVALVSIGAWYFIKELSLLQTRLIEAERNLATSQVNQAKAEAAAQSSVDKARGEILTEQAKRISELNDASVAVSKRIQELVSGQLENMTKLEARAAIQAQLADARQKEREDAAHKEVDALRVQVTNLEARRTSLIAETAVAGYLEVRNKLAEELVSGRSFQIDSLVGLLRTRLSDSDLRSRANNDRQDRSLPWQLRLLLNVELYSLSNDDHLIAAIADLLEQNKTRLDYSVGNVFFGIGSRLPDSAEQPITELFIRLLLDEDVSLIGHVALAGVVRFEGSVDKYVKQMPGDRRELAARSVGRRFLAASEQGWHCGFELNLLRHFSTEASLAFASHALASTTQSKIRECIDEQLRAWGNPPLPSPEARLKWVQ